MGIAVPGLFQRYEFDTERGAVASQVFTLDQEQCLQNELARLAEEKISIAYDPANPGLFSFQHEYLRGQVELLKFLLERSEAAKVSLLTDYKEPS